MKVIIFKLNLTDFNPTLLSVNKMYCSIPIHILVHYIVISSYKEKNIISLLLCYPLPKKKYGSGMAKHGSYNNYDPYLGMVWEGWVKIWN